MTTTTATTPNNSAVQAPVEGVNYSTRVDKVGRRAQTVRVANGPTFKGGTEQDVFVLRPDGNTAERRRVKIGLASFDHVEIAEGVSAGETVIISDLSKYKNTDILNIQQ